MGPNETVKIAVQIDDQAPQTVAFIPDSAPGTLPDAWDGNDGFAANAIVSVVTNWTASPGAHTLKVSEDITYRQNIKADISQALDGGTGCRRAKDSHR